MKLFEKYYNTFYGSSLLVCLAALLLACMTKEFIHLSLAAASLPLIALALQGRLFCKKQLAEEHRWVQEISRLRLSTMECLARALDAKDQYTHGHIRRVQYYARELGLHAGLSDNQLNCLHAAALLHDIGKLAISESILNKPGKLTKSEYDKMKLHPLVGVEILSHVDFLSPVIPAIRHHHERYDGKGYPDGLQGEAIPRLARIMALADFYDALRSHRPYRRALSQSEVLAIISAEKGKMFDPHLADLFCRHIPAIEEGLLSMPELDFSILRRALLTTMDSADEATLAVVAPAINHSRMNSTHQAVFDLNDLAQNWNSRLDLEDVLAITCLKIIKLAPVTTCVVYLSNGDGDRLEARHAAGRHVDYFREFSLRRDQGITGWALTSRRMIANSDSDFDLGEALPNLAGAYRSATAIPLLQDGQAFGALTLYSKEANALNSEHLRLLEIVMSPLAHAIATAKARQHTRDETLTDAITGLPNHQALQVKADESIQNALRHGKDLTLLLLDLDRFSEINERFGFHVGDQFLHEIGQLMRSCLRPSDFLARTENDAFVAVLPDTSPERAATALAQIESAVAAHCLRVSNGEEIYTTISAGYASLCDDGRSLADLLGKAHCRLSNRAVTPFVAGVAAYACGNQVH